MTPSSPQQAQAAYEYLQYCGAAPSPTVVLDSVRISQLKLEKKVSMKEQIKELFFNLPEKIRLTLPKINL